MCAAAEFSGVLECFRVVQWRAPEAPSNNASGCSAGAFLTLVGTLVATLVAALVGTSVGTSFEVPTKPC